MMNSNNNILKILLRGLILREEFLLQKEGEKSKRGRDKLGSDGWVYGIDIDDGFMGVCLSPNTVSFVYI